MSPAFLFLVVAAACTGYAAGIEFGNWTGNAPGWLALGAFCFIVAHALPGKPPG